MAHCALPARRKVLLALAAGLAATVVRAQPTVARPLRLGLPPYLPYDRIQERFAPFAGWLASELGRRVDIRVGQSYDEHLDFVARAAVDFALLGPVALATLLQRKVPLALLGRHHANAAGRLQGELVVRADSPLREVRALRGHRLAYVHPLSATGFLAPRLLLRQHGLGDRTQLNPRFVGSDGNVAFAVLAGECDAGGLPADTFAELTGRGLRSLAPLPALPEFVFAATPRLATAEQSVLRDALVSLRRSADGRQILARMRPGLTAIVAVDGAEYLALAPLIAAMRGSGS